MIAGSFSIGNLQKISLIGRGVSGAVYKYLNKSNNEFVAVKKIKPRGLLTGIPQEAIREIAILKNANIPGVLRLIGIFTKKESIYIVTEFIQTSLESKIKDEKFFAGKRYLIREILRYILKTLCVLHKRGYIHRDIKTANILLKDNIPILIDFGLTKFCAIEEPLSPNVCTIWYRAPELLMGEREYGPEVDIWAVGMVFAEFFTGEPILQGKGEISQLALIFDLFGHPDTCGWKEAKELPNYVDFEKRTKKDLNLLFSNMEELEMDLFEKMTSLNPKKRSCAEDCLKHPYFKKLF